MTICISHPPRCADEICHFERRNDYRYFHFWTTVTSLRRARTCDSSNCFAEMAGYDSTIAFPNRLRITSGHGKATKYHAKEVRTVVAVAVFAYFSFSIFEYLILMCGMCVLRGNARDEWQPCLTSTTFQFVSLSTPNWFYFFPSNWKDFPLTSLPHRQAVKQRFHFVTHFSCWWLYNDCVCVFVWIMCECRLRVNDLMCSPPSPFNLNILIDDCISS